MNTVQIDLKHPFVLNCPPCKYLKASVSNNHREDETDLLLSLLSYLSCSSIGATISELLDTQYDPWHRTTSAYVGETPTFVRAMPSHVLGRCLGKPASLQRCSTHAQELLFPKETDDKCNRHVLWTNSQKGKLGMSIERNAVSKIGEAPSQAADLKVQVGWVITQIDGVEVPPKKILKVCI